MYGYNEVTCIDVEQGTTVWARQPTVTEYAGIIQIDALDPARVIVLSADGTINALCTRDGSTQWTILAPKRRNSTPAIGLTITPTEILAPRADHILMINPDDGSIRTRQQLPKRSRVTAPVVSAAGMLYVACKEKIFAIARTPEPSSHVVTSTQAPVERPPASWSVRPPQRREGVILVADDQHIIAEDAVSLMALSPTTGEVLWRLARGECTPSQSAWVTGHDIFFIANVAYEVAELICVDRHTQRPRWRIPITGAYQPRVIGLSDHHVYVDRGGAVSIHTHRTGQHSALVTTLADAYRPQCTIQH